MRDILLLKGFRVFFMLLLAASLYSCSSQQNNVLFDRRKALGDGETTMLTVPPYHIQPQDVLQVRNLQNIKYIVNDIGSTTTTGGSDKDGQTYTVDDDGTVALPMIGRIEVGGLTRIEAAKKIQDIYATTIKNPIIEVKLINLSVTVLGEVRSPGNYQLLKDRTALVEVLGRAGGLTEKADEHIKIVRGGDAADPQEFIVDLGSVNDAMSKSKTILQNQDVIYVAQNKKAVRNEKMQRFSNVIQPVLLLMNTALIIYTLTK